jgi:hypothetical protein
MVKENDTMSDTLSELDGFEMNVQVTKNIDGKIMDFIKMEHPFDPEEKEDSMQWSMSTNQGFQRKRKRTIH